MAVKIPIVTVFDSKGLKQAQYQLNQVRGNVQNLGRNFAIAGAAIAGFGAFLGQAVMNAADAQKVMAQTEAVLKSTGTTANGTAQDIANLSEKLMRMTGFEDEAIQSGANLLLTFKNIRNEAGRGNDIFNQTTQAMLDVARAMGTDASTEAIRLGKALNDPIRGITALTRVGIQFTDQQKEQIKALVETGDLMGAQKIILAELQSQFGGSGAAYVTTFAGQLDVLKGELGNMSEEIGFIVMPALQELFAELKELIPVIGPQIRDAIAEVDWKGLTTTIVNLTTWFLKNAETIGIVVAAFWTLNTAYNAGRVAVGLYNAAAVLLNNTMKSGATLAGTLRSALLLTGVVAAVGAVVTEYGRAKTAIERATPAASSFNKEVYAASSAVAKMSPWIKLLVDIMNGFIGSTDKAKGFNTTISNTNRLGFGNHLNSINQIEAAWKRAKIAVNNYNNAVPSGVTGVRSIGINTSAKSSIVPPSLPVTSNSKSVANSYAITVNAGMGTDGNRVGQIIVDEIIKFERSSGQVFARA